MTKIFLLISLMISANVSFAKMDPFVNCITQMGNVIDSLELEVISDRYGREGVKATVYHMDESTTVYVTEVETKKVAAAYAKKTIKLYLRNPEASPKFVTITINGENGSFAGTGLNLYGPLTCQWAK